MYLPMYRAERQSSEFFLTHSNKNRVYVKKKKHEKEKDKCTSLAKVHFLYSMESSSVGVHVQCCQI